MEKTTKKEAFEKLKWKKIYTGQGLVAKDVQQQLFKAGYVWTGKNVGKLRQKAGSSCFYIYTNTDGTMKEGWYDGRYEENERTEMSAMEVLRMDIQEEPRFKCKDEVLVRNRDSDWCFAIYSHGKEFEFSTIHYVAPGVRVERCIHYEGNEHLLGTKYSPEGGEE